MPKLSLAELLLYSTVKLTSKKSGASTGSGTGFFYAFCKEGERRVPAIITNKHVIAGSDEVVVICHTNENGKPIPNNFARLNISLAPGGVAYHPDPNIDLCAIFIGDFVTQAQEAGKELFYCELGPELIPKMGDWQYFDAMEEVTMLGCPNGLSDEVNNLPIARRGISASHLSKDYNGKREFLVDMACFPGSSGSPIFVYDRNGYLDRKTNSYQMGTTRALLVGILYAGPLITNTGQIILGQPATVQISAMMHLGNAIRSTAVHELESVVKQMVNI